MMTLTKQLRIVEVFTICTEPRQAGSGKYNNQPTSHCSSGASKPVTPTLEGDMLNIIPWMEGMPFGTLVIVVGAVIDVSRELISLSDVGP